MSVLLGGEELAPPGLADRAGDKPALIGRLKIDADLAALLPFRMILVFGFLL
jgi:hypothetical protein